MDEIGKVIDQADQEMKYETILAKIEKEWDYMKLKVVPYIPETETFILSNSDSTFDKIEDHLTTLENVLSSRNAFHVKEKIDEWMKNLIVMRDNLEKWIEAQNNWMYLDPIFASQEIQQALPSEHTAFLELQDSLKKIYFSAYMNPKAVYNLVVNNRAEIFDGLISYFTRIKKIVDDFLEERRLKYPRFFFLTD